MSLILVDREKLMLTSSLPEFQALNLSKKIVQKVKQVVAKSSAIFFTYYS